MLMGEQEAKKPGLLQIMRLASSKDFQKNIEKSQAQLNHGHAMLAEIMPEHEKIHATCVNAELRKSAGDDMANAVENGLCMYRLISFMYVQKFGMVKWQECKAKYPGVE